MRFIEVTQNRKALVLKEKYNFGDVLRFWESKYVDAGKVDGVYKQKDIEHVRFAPLRNAAACWSLPDEKWSWDCCGSRQSQMLLFNTTRDGYFNEKILYFSHWINISWAHSQIFLLIFEIIFFSLSLDHRTFKCFFFYRYPVSFLNTQKEKVSLHCCSP